MRRSLRPRSANLVSGSSTSVVERPWASEMPGAPAFGNVTRGSSASSSAYQNQYCLGRSALSAPASRLGVIPEVHRAVGEAARVHEYEVHANIVGQRLLSASHNHRCEEEVVFVHETGLDRLGCEFGSTNADVLVGCCLLSGESLQGRNRALPWVCSWRAHRWSSGSLPFVTVVNEGGQPLDFVEILVRASSSARKPTVSAHDEDPTRCPSQRVPASNAAVARRESRPSSSPCVGVGFPSADGVLRGHPIGQVATSVTTVVSLATFLRLVVQGSDESTTEVSE